jgi:hypothetical protein
MIEIEHYVKGIQQACAGNQSLKRTACTVVVLERAHFSSPMDISSCSLHGSATLKTKILEDQR